MFAIGLGQDAELFALEPHHAPEFFAHMERGRQYIGEFVGFADAAADLEAARTLLSGYAQKAAQDTGRLYGIRLGGELVGGVLFRVFDARSGNCEIGCWLEPTATGRGLVNSACRVLIDWAFHERGMHRVEWWAAAANESSLAAAARLGMTREGVMRQSYLHRGTRHDMEVWSVLSHEWPPSDPA
ncbi:GNAT family N-acetyltransferase [Streptomyces sp. NPDC006879]|uniref:GNAT family N-acetyltransferase n=1 Tax=Streptomyces sp. NPDC006879 TaxID=3364767 RepID=UPI00367BCB73